MATYALQWHAMQLARAEGCRVYDLFGIPPTGAAAHPMHGLYRFKTGFGGFVLHRRGCWDYPLREEYSSCRGSEMSAPGFHTFRHA
jgi:lipid II:glycine glycyltransferase (peptidoglycan interpeptide bridge formation enzyme)